MIKGLNLNVFNGTNLFNAATELFRQLNIQLNSNTAEPLPVRDVLKNYFKDNDTFNAIDKTFFIGIIQDSVFQNSIFEQKYTADEALEEGDKNYNGLMLFALELKKQPTRSEISELTRAFNRISHKMPVALVLKYIVENEAVISIAISERFKYLQNWRQGEKPGKVIILRDIHTQKTHAGHIRILNDLKNHSAKDFNELHQHWLQVLDVSILNKKFFQELSNWYFAAMDEVSFPDDLEKKKDVRNATNLIRLITRIIFIWFIKEKQLVPARLFQKDYLKDIIKNFNKNTSSHNYYNAILQNLFFGTLNQKIEERKFAKEGDIETNKQEYGVKNLFRYADLFTIPEKEVLALFKDVPFLNGGLFDCLDKPNDEGKIEYVDGFSRNPRKRAILPDYLFFSDERDVDLTEYYDPKAKRKSTYKVRGLINFLENYKFTIAENTPIEEEVALDPELLGKVFENLLASYNPETQTTARKQTGSFYTPREIVNYMVDESLLEYLKQAVGNKVSQVGRDLDSTLRDVFSYSENPNPFNEAETRELIEAINNCKILDPACGSGAFPMGILHKMVHILQKLDPENKYWKETQRERIIGNEIKKLEQDKKVIEGLSDEQVREKALIAVKQRLDELEEIFNKSYNFDDYSRKLFLIENCIYGVDIQPIAVQIAKLRCFISLVIDQKVNKNKENFGIRSLPNLETKFVAANTLIGLDKPQQMQLRNPAIEAKENELKELRHKYFTANTRKEKIILQKQDKKLRQEIAQMLENDGWNTKVAKQIVAFDPYDQNHFANWFDPEWMFGITTGFDIVIGNPPYVQLQKDDGKLANEFQSQNFQTFDRMGDIYALFYEKGIQLLKQNAHLCFITSNKWMRAGYGKKLRQFFANYNPLLLIDLGPGVFESATVDTNILLIQNSKTSSDSFYLKALTLQRQNSEVDIAAQVKEKAVMLTKLTHDAWFIGSNAEQQLKEKIERIGKPLKDWDVKIYRGILTGLNEAFIISTEKRNEILANCRTKEERNRTEKIIKPILRGRDIKRYYYEWAGLWVIVIPAGWTDENRGAFDAKKFINENFYSLMQYLKQFEEKAKKRDDQGDYWWELRHCAYYSEFEKEKVVYPNMATRLMAVWDNNNFFTNQKCFIITGKQTKFITALLNSTLEFWYFKNIGATLGREGYEMSKIFMENLPLPTITTSNEPIVKQIEELVDKILVAKGASGTPGVEPLKVPANIDTSNWEREIDRLVYQLYELTDEEIRIIEMEK